MRQQCHATEGCCDTCLEIFLLKQAMVAYATDKRGLVQEVGDFSRVWHGEKPGSLEGEFFLGTAVAYDPVYLRSCIAIYEVRERPCCCT